ncbi:MAG: right-handed parallel beta-helix repeat-containing protein [Burkholderiales bacterium]|nr:right-handed parallel beta-helix repeat-containing protein [Burkholderiales bacterium]
MRLRRARLASIAGIAVVVAMAGFGARCAAQNGFVPQNASGELDLGPPRAESAARGLVPPSTGVCADLATSFGIGVPNPPAAPPEQKPPSLPDRPKIVRPEWYGAKGDGVTDDTVALNTALAAVADDGDVVLTPGRTYLKRNFLLLDTPGVRLWGNGAVIHARVEPDEERGPPGTMHQSIVLTAPRAAIFDTTLTTNVRRRHAGNREHLGIRLEGPDQQAIGNRVEYLQVGIFVRGATRPVVARNVIYRTTADAIHQTTGSADGTVVCNLVREAGDDGIAVVNYGLGPPNVRGFLIAGNDVADQYQGRGISVVGGADVTIRDNRVQRTGINAGIYVASERSYKTAAVRNVLVERNEIVDVQTRAPVYNPKGALRLTGQAAIDIGGDLPEQTIDGVVVRGNRIAGTARDGIRIRGNACDVRLEGNRMEKVRQFPIAIAPPTRPGCAFACVGNTADGAGVDARGCAAGPAGSAVTGRGPAPAAAPLRKE